LKNVVTHLYADYLRYTDQFRALAWRDDLLKPVEKRLLLTLYNIAPTKFQKSAKVVGICLGSWHPHGDLSTYGALVGLVQRGFAEGQGNWGSPGLVDSKAASQRYSECKANKFLTDGFTEFLDFVPWSEFELDSEPHYLPFYIPIGLIGEGLIQGISLHTCKIPRYNFIDLIKRLVSILENHEVRPVLVPNLGANAIYENSPGEFERICKTGEGILQCIPKTLVAKNGIHILSKNPINGLSQLLSFNAEYEVKHGIPYYDVVDLSKKGLNVFVSPKKGVLTQAFVKEIITIISCKIHVKCNVVINLDGNVALAGIDELLLNSYTKWLDAYKAKLIDELTKLNQKLLELNIIVIVRSIISANPTVKTIAEIIKFNTSTYTSKEIEAACSKYRIKTLIEADLDIPGVQAEIINVTNNIANIASIGLARMKSLI
jgi:DNA gyrase/topoisomerase IV subunit A